MMKTKCQSVTKFEPNVIGEDASLATSGRIVVSDGAGGGGVFAEKWSAYLCETLPDEPIETFGQFNEWIDAVWETFYNEQETEAKRIGGLFLNKFYDEGSFATIAAIWVDENDKLCRWMTYGDSVVFRYNRKSGALNYTFPSLSDFVKPPYLVSLLNPSDEKGFHAGNFALDRDSICFVASDALSQYVIMMYLYAIGRRSELEPVAHGTDKLGNTVKSLLASNVSVDFYKDVLNPLCRSVCYHSLDKTLLPLHDNHLLMHDDYSLAIMGYKLFTK